MKKLLIMALGTTMALSGTQHVFGMYALRKALEFAHIVGPAAAAETFTDRCDRLLKSQDYSALSTELYAALDNLDDSTKRFQAHHWITENLKKGLDAFLLYMDARTVLKFNPVDHRVYPSAFENLILCIILTAVAQEVASSFGYESAPGKGIPDLAASFKKKFRRQHGDGTLNAGIRGKVLFDEVKTKALEKLQALHDVDESIAALPLPHWVLRTTCGWSLGWGITWSTLTPKELATRDNAAFAGALTAATKIVLGKQIEALTAMTTWEEFLGFAASESKDEAGDDEEEEE